MRFFPETKTVRVGETVEWTNTDQMTGHTVTFGLNDPPGRLGVNANLDSDGAMHAIVGLPTDNVSSGGLRPLFADRAVSVAGLPLTFTDLMQWPLPVAVTDLNQRFRVTFTHPGTYNYRCIFHDNLGMLGRVIVLP